LNFLPCPLGQGRAVLELPGGGIFLSRELGRGEDSGPVRGEYKSG